MTASRLEDFSPALRAQEKEHILDLVNRLRAELPMYDEAKRIMARLITAGDDGTWAGELDPVRVHVYQIAILAEELAKPRGLSAAEAPTSADAVTKMVDRARGYLAMNAAESGADVLIDELASLLVTLDAEIARLREALRDLLAVTDPAGMTEEIMADKEKMARFIDDCERDTKAAVDRARSALGGV